MILTIINLICLLSIIAVVLYIVLTYNSLKKDIDKMLKIVPDVGYIGNKFKDVYVPGGPSPASPSAFSNEPRLVPMSQTVRLEPTPTNYVPPTEAMKTYYTVLKTALDVFQGYKTNIIKLISSPEFYNTKDDQAKKILRDSTFIVPIIEWYVYENSVTKSALSQKDINEMYTALNFLNNPEYKFTSATGETIHFSTLAVSSSLQQFYANNKAYLDTCLRDKTC